MPKPSRPAVLCTALYTLTGGRLKGRMVTTMAKHLGITFEDAEVLAEECAKRGWLDHTMYTVTLREGGYAAALRVLQGTARKRPPGVDPLARRLQHGAGIVPRGSACQPAALTTQRALGAFS